jgi:hypothetical protein
VTRGDEVPYKVGERVMLSMLHWHWGCKAKGEKHVAKFLPRFNSPYTITKAHPETSTYTLEIPNSRIFPTFHALELKTFVANNATLFPMCELAQPGPILMENGLEEYFVEEILEASHRGCGWQFLVQWLGYGPEHDQWLPASELEECEVLDVWYQGRRNGPAQS